MIGSRLGPYRIASELGSGGMGTVYLAESDATGRVALKVVHAHLLETPGFFKRFLREAELGMRIEHPNVVRTLDVDALMVDERHVHYLVMEYVEGRSLRSLLESLGRVPEALVREIGVQVAAGLQAIHDAGIVHRDLKPENILITDAHQVRIMDLGIAKLVEASIALTMEGQFTGSLRYAAPEQFHGEEVGPAADLYSLGTVLFELATGHNPFHRRSSTKTMHAHLEEVPPPARDLCPELSEFSSGLIAVLLAKQPEGRLASAGLLGSVLEEGESSSWWSARARSQERTPRPTIAVQRDAGMHGRQEELQHLQAAWERAREGEGTAVLLCGEAGIGKTRLVDAFIRSVHSGGAYVLYGSYPPTGGDGLARSLATHFGPDRIHGELARYLQSTPGLVAGLSALALGTPPPEGTRPLGRDAVQTACCLLLQALAADKPTLWVVDDLHFATAESRAVLLAMARVLQGHRALLLLTARPGLPEAELAHYAMLAHFRRMDLDRLSPREVVELLREVFGSEDLADELGGRIAYKSDGVPYFVFQMIQGLKESGSLRQAPDGTFVQTSTIADIEVPSAVRDLIEARLNELGKIERSLCDLAAVLGFEFDPGLLATALGSTKVAVLQDLAELERRTSIVRSSGRAYRFDHHQIQEVLYEQLPLPLREEYHTLVADTYEAGRGATDLGEAAVFLAGHRLRGSRPRDALASLDAALERLQLVGHHDRAQDVAERALAVPGLVEDRRRVELLLERVMILDRLGRRAEAVEPLREAVAFADQLEAEDLHSEALRSLGMHFIYTSRYEDSVAPLERALEIARRTHNREAEAAATGSLGSSYWARGRYPEAAEMHRRHLRLAKEAGFGRGEMSASANLGNTLWNLGYFEEALAHHRRHLELAPECGTPENVVTGLGNVGALLTHMGRYAEALRSNREGLQTAREIGFRRGEAIANGNLGFLLSECGEFAEAGRYAGRQRLLAREISDRRLEAYAIHDLAKIAERRGDGEEALAGYTEAIEVWREIGDRAGAAHTLAARGGLRLDRADPEGARQDLEEARKTARDIEDPGAELLAASHTARLDPSRVPEVRRLLAASEDRVPPAEEMEARFRLYETAGEKADLDRARLLLDKSVQQAPPELRNSMRTRVRLHRRIVEATEA